VSKTDHPGVKRDLQLCKYSKDRKIREQRRKEVRVPDDVVLGINVRGKEKILKIWEN
jgi:hypothetical protein